MGLKRWDVARRASEGDAAMAEAGVIRQLVGPNYAPRIRAERLIATSRVVLAAFSLMAVWLDPYTPPIHERTTYFLLLGYLTYSLTVAAVVWLAHAVLVRLGLITHVLDLSLFSMLTYFTEGPTSPFFMYFMFSIVGATLRWHWHGALWTAAAALVGFNGIGVYASEVVNNPAFEENRFIIRSVYLAVMAGLLGYLGAYEERRRREMSQLAVWPRALPSDRKIPQPAILESAARVLGAPRVLLAWEELDEPWLRLALWSKSECRSWREAPATFHPVVADALAGLSFLSKDVGAPVPLVLHSPADEPRRWRGAPIHSALRSRFAMANRDRNAEWMGAPRQRRGSSAGLCRTRGTGAPTSFDRKLNPASASATTGWNVAGASRQERHSLLLHKASRNQGSSSSSHASSTRGAPRTRAALSSMAGCGIFRSLGSARGQTANWDISRRRRSS